MAEWLADNMNKIAYDVLYNSQVTELYRGLQKKYDVQGKPFIFQVSGLAESARLYMACVDIMLMVVYSLIMPMI